MRRIIAVTGRDAQAFLQGLVTNDVARAARDGIAWAALLTPQGKYLADFFIVARPDGFWLDADAGQAEDLLRRLTLYRLRAAVELAPLPAASVTRGTGPAPAGALPDPRHPDLGWRLYAEGPQREATDATDWDALRVALTVPEAGVELLPGETFILEAGFERLHGVDFRKGCYVGQEVTARMKHKAELRRGLATVPVEGAAPPGTPITREGREVGTLHTQAGGRGLAMLRLDRVGEGMEAGTARVGPPAG